MVMPNKFADTNSAAGAGTTVGLTSPMPLCRSTHSRRPPYPLALRRDTILDQIVGAAMAHRTDGRLGLHDLQRGYLRGMVTDAPARHRALVERYRVACGGDWEELPADDYVFGDLPRHMRDAGMAEDLAALLADYGWLAGGLAATGSLTGATIQLDGFSTEEAHAILAEILRNIAHVVAERPGLLAQQLMGRLPAEVPPRLTTLWQSARAAIARVQSPSLTPATASLLPHSPELRRTLTGHAGAVTAVALAGGRALSGSHDRTLRLWDLDSGACLRVLEGHTGAVATVALAGGRALSGSWDHTLRLWDLDSGACL